MKVVCNKWFWTFVCLLCLAAAASAEQVAIATAGPDSIELYDTPVHGLCPEGLKEALYKHPQAIIRGCWRMAPDGDVLTIFEDGDAYKIPVNKFTWKSGKKPATL